MNLMNLDHPVYTNLNKVRGQTNTSDIFGVIDDKKACAIIKKAFPDLTPMMLEALRDMHDLLSTANQTLWLDIINKAALDTWGRPYVITDYRVSGIGSNEFSTFYKDMLRETTQKKSKHNHLARLYGLMVKTNKAKK